MKVFNSVMNTYPLIVHAQGSSHMSKEWLDIVETYPKVIKSSLSSDVTIVSFFAGKKEMSLRKQLDRSLVEYTNAVPSKKSYWVNTFKIMYLVEILKEVKTEYVLCLDGLDTLLNEDMSELVSRFISFNADIVYNASKVNFPIMCEDSEETESVYKHLNAGAFIGRTKSLSEFYEFLLKTELNVNYPGALLSEQIRVRNGRNKYSKKETIKVDTECILFQTLDKSNFDFKDDILKVW